MGKDMVIKVDDVSMKFRLASEKITSMKHYFIKKIKKEIQYEEFYALKNINIEINKGEIVGFIGLNGAGKSTLLKIIAGVLKPTSGSVLKKGKVAPLIELGAGFDQDLTGMENIYLNGLMLGYSKKFINEHIDEIVEFSELGKFINTPLKNYSSGMKARLGFSIATIVNPDILIVDEVLSVGDFKFKKKCEEKIQSMIKSGATVIFVSHSIEQVQKLCNRVVWLEKGRVKEKGEAMPICEKYKKE